MRRSAGNVGTRTPCNATLVLVRTRSTHTTVNTAYWWNTRWTNAKLIWFGCELENGNWLSCEDNATGGVCGVGVCINKYIRIRGKIEFRKEQIQLFNCCVVQFILKLRNFDYVYGFCARIAIHFKSKYISRSRHRLQVELLPCAEAKH